MSLRVSFFAFDCTFMQSAWVNDVGLMMSMMNLAVMNSYCLIKPSLFYDSITESCNAPTGVRDWTFTVNWCSLKHPTGIQ